MQPDIHYVTLIFSKVKDPDSFVSKIKRTVSFPIIKEQIQNDGVVVLVVKGFEEGSAEKFMSAFCEEFNFPDVQCYEAKGNIFEY